MPKPFFSVIMPTKDRATLIQESIQSVINQTFDSWELVIIDDHSTDNTEEIIRKINHPKIKYFKLKEGTGPSPARDLGIRQAEGEIIIIADSDDINYPERLELTYQIFQKNPKIDVVYGLAERHEMDGSLFLRPGHEFNPELLKMYNYIPNCAAAFKKNFYLKNSGYDFNIKTSEDYDLWLSFLEKGANFYFLPKPIVEQRIHPQGTISTVEIDQKTKNLAYVRTKHNLPRPDFSEVKKLVQDKDLLDFISTPQAIQFWFNNN